MQISGPQSLVFLFSTFWVEQWYSLWNIWRIKYENAYRKPITCKATVCNPSFYSCISFYL